MTIVGRHRQPSRGAGRGSKRVVASFVLGGGAVVVAVLVCLRMASSSASPLSSRAGCGSDQRPVTSRICARRGSSLALRVASVVEAQRRRYSLRSVVFGVWWHGAPLITGAIGSAYPGVPAMTGVHFRIGNTTETFESTLLLELVDRGKMRLTDRLSKWFPDLPDARQLTVEMLASSTTGYANYVNNNAFVTRYHADPFRAWTPDELVQYGISQPAGFRPGMSWAFSDTNFVILGEILAKVGGRPVSQQIQKMILNPLRLRDTIMTPTAAIPAPVLHGYTTERGVYEDSTFWSPSWVTYAADMTSDLHDMGVWARALGKGSLLSAESRRAQFAPTNVGKGKLTPSFYYGLGGGVANGWVLATPRLMGYTGIVSDLPSKDLALVVFTTSNPDAPPGTHYAGAIFDRVGALLSPSSPPRYPAGP